MKSCRIVGKQVYSVCFKEVDGVYIVVEANENSSIYGGYVDLIDIDLYQELSYLSE